MITDYNASKCLFFLGLASLLFLFQNCGKKKEPKPFEFRPKHYVCYQTWDSLTIDGYANEPSWQEVDWTADFEDIEGDKKPAPFLKTNVKMLWDSTYFYFFAQMEEPHVWATLTERDAVIFQDDDFEIFIDPDGDGHHYYEFEINAFNTLWDLYMLWPYHIGKGPNYLFNWNIPDIKTAVHIEGSLNDPSDEDQYWTVEVAIPWSALEEMASHKGIPKSGEQWRINFSRVDWPMDIQNDGYVKQKDRKDKNLRENNWVWQATELVDMHRPERWGFVQFSDNQPGTTEDEFIFHPDDKIKSALWDLYYQQKAFAKEHGIYSNNINQFRLTNIPDCSFNPVFYTSPNSFEISAQSCQSNGIWLIRQDGKVEYIKGH